MKRSILYFTGILMTIAGLAIGCAHDRCGSGSCSPQSGSYTSGPRVEGGQYDSGNAGPVLQTGPVHGGGQPTFSTPGPGRDSYGGSGSR